MLHYYLLTRHLQGDIHEVLIHRYISIMFAFTHNEQNTLGTITPHYQRHNHHHGYIKVVGICKLRRSGVGGLSKKAVLSLGV